MAFYLDTANSIVKDQRTLHGNGASRHARALSSLNNVKCTVRKLIPAVGMRSRTSCICNYMAKIKFPVLDESNTYKTKFVFTALKEYVKAVDITLEELQGLNELSDRCEVKCKSNSRKLKCTKRQKRTDSNKKERGTGKKKSRKRAGKRNTRCRDARLKNLHSRRCYRAHSGHSKDD